MATLMTNLGIMERARKLLDAAGRRAWKQEVKNREATEAFKAEGSNDCAPPNHQPIWMETEARVTECHHEPLRIGALTLRITKGTNRLIVTFTYYAHGHTYYDQFRSPVARTQGEAFSVYYNALSPRQNTRSPLEFINRRPMSDTAILGFILISILVLSLVRG